MEVQALKKTESPIRSNSHGLYGTPFFQPKLTINQPNDSYEQEADAVADKVVKSEGNVKNESFFKATNNHQNIQRKCEHCMEEEKKVQRKPLAENITPLVQRKSDGGTPVPNNLGERINTSRGNGISMDGDTRKFMSNSFGTDFSNVKIHTGSEANQLSSDINAKAFTSGSDVFFNSGQYQPQTTEGKHLLAHELTHVLQQRSGSVQTDRVQRYPWPYQNKQWHEVNETVTETISGAPTAYAAWNNTYTWNSKFAISLNAISGTAWLIVKLYSTADLATRRAWERAIQNKWNTNYHLKITPPGVSEGACQFPIRVDVQWMKDAADAHYAINPQGATGTSGGRSGVGGTSSMTDWGTADRTDITHEFGHMLGNAEEYFTTNGTDYTHGGTDRGFRDTNAGVMNNPTENVRRRHFELFRSQVAIMLGLRDSKVQIINGDGSLPTCQIELGDFPTSTLPEGQAYA